MATKKFHLSFKILNGPSLMELMLAHYDPLPFGKDQDCREIEFTLEARAAKSEVNTSVIAIRILGTRRKKLTDVTWTFEGISYDYGRCEGQLVRGRFNVKTRKGRVRIGPYQNFSGR